MRHRRRIIYPTGPATSVAGCVLALVCTTAGCNSAAPTTQPLTAAQQQDMILNDPMGYKPSVGHDISGGDITHFDQSGFNKDVNDALDP